MVVELNRLAAESRFVLFPKKVRRFVVLLINKIIYHERIKNQNDSADAAEGVQ